MKKLKFLALLMVAVAFMLTSCGESNNTFGSENYDTLYVLHNDSNHTVKESIVVFESLYDENTGKSDIGNLLWESETIKISAHSLINYRLNVEKLMSDFGNNICIARRITHPAKSKEGSTELIDDWSYWGWMFSAAWVKGKQIDIYDYITIQPSRWSPDGRYEYKELEREINIKSIY